MLLRITATAFARWNFGSAPSQPRNGFGAMMAEPARNHAGRDKRAEFVRGADNRCRTGDRDDLKSARDCGGHLGREHIVEGRQKSRDVRSVKTMSFARDFNLKMTIERITLDRSNDSIGSPIIRMPGERSCFSETTHQRMYDHFVQFFPSRKESRKTSQARPHLRDPAPGAAATVPTSPAAAPSLFDNCDWVTRPASASLPRARIGAGALT